MSNIRAVNFIDQATGLPFGVLNVNGRQGVSSAGWLDEIAQGNIPGAGDFQVSGRNAAVGLAAYETAWNVGATYNYLASPQVIEASSSSANDTVAGTGARYITILGLIGTGWLFGSVTIPMAGAAWSQTTGTNFIRVWQAYVVDTGAANTNVGTITIRGTVAPQPTIAQINTNAGYTSMAVWTVPGDATGYLQTVNITIESGKVGSGRVIIKPNFLATLGLNPMSWITSEFSIDSSAAQRTLMPAIDLLPRTDIEIQAIAGVANTPVTAEMDFWYI